MTVDDYALKMLYEGAESYAEDDMDESGELDGEDDLADAIRLTIDMAHAIRDNPVAFRTWFRSVTA